MAVLTTTISAAANKSATIDLTQLLDRDSKIFALAFVGTDWTSASVTFQVSEDGSTWYNLYSEGSEYTIAVGSNAAVDGSAKACTVDPIVFSSWNYIRLRSGTSATPVAQTNAQTIKLFVRTF